MTEQQNYGQPNQQSYPHGQPQVQQPFPPQQQGYQGQSQPPYQNPYQNPYQQPGQQPPYPPQQYGAPQAYPQPQPQQPYPQVPPQQYQGQQFPGQQPYGYPQQAPGQPYPQDPAQDQNQPKPKPKPKKKRSRWAIFFIVLFSPLIALAFVFYGIYWVLTWLLTPVALVLHFVFCGIGLIWYSGVKVLASGNSKYRLFQPMYPKFPPLWTGAYWVRLNRNVRSTAEGLAAVAQLLDW